MTYQLILTTIRRMNIPHLQNKYTLCTTTRKLTTKRPIITSRQYKNELLSKRPPTTKPPKPNHIIPDSEKPWPKGWQILGYTVLVLTIPCSVATYIVENHWIREYLLENTNHYVKDMISFLRENFGPRVWYYPELKDGFVEMKEEHYFDYMNDYPMVHKAEIEIEDLMDYSNYRVEVMLNQGLSFCYVLKGSIIMNLESLKDALNVSTILDGDKDVSISVDFLDDDNYEEELTSTTPDEIKETKDNHTQIRKVSSAFSTWHHFPPAGSTDLTMTNTGAMSEKEMKISKLEYREKELNALLNDKDCTASVDDLISELKDVRRDLYRLKGKWVRWGWVSLFH